MATVVTDQTTEQQDDATSEVDQSPSLTIDKSLTNGDDAIVDTAGEIIEYTITVDNTGNQDLTTVVLGDLFADAGATLFSGDVNTNSILETDETWVYTAQYTVTQADINAGTALVNVATVVTDQTTEQQDDATSTVDQSPDLTLDKVLESYIDDDLSGTVTAGDTLTYSFETQNTGNVTLTGVMITDPLDGLSALTCTPAQPSTLAPLAAMTCTATYVVTALDAVNGSVTNTATADSNETGPVDDSVFVPIVAPPLVCNLGVEKTCCLPPAPTAPSDGTDCMGKIVSMQFEYTAEDCSSTTNTQDGKAKCTGGNIIDEGAVSIEFTGKGSEKLSSMESVGIMKGDIVEFNTTASTFSSGTKFSITNDGDESLSQYLEVHTSCSVPLNVGDQFGSMRLVQLVSTEGGTATENPLPGGEQQVSACITAGDPVGTDCDADMTELTLVYTGAACQNPLDNTQGDKAECIQGTGEGPVSITFTGKNGDKLVATPPSGIGIGDSFTVTNIDGSKLSAETMIEFWDEGDSLSQYVNIHTSCSQRISLGDVFGAVTVASFIDINGEHLLAEPTPTSLTNVCAIQTTTTSTSCTGKLEGLTFAYRGGDCDDSNNPQEGKLTCTDNGAGPGTSEPVRIVVGGSGKDAGKIYGDFASVDIDENVTALASNGGKSTLGAESIATIYSANGTLLEDIVFHTSCSKPLNLGDRFGALEVVAMSLEDGTTLSNESTGNLVEYMYVITNNDSSGVDVSEVWDDPLGPISGGFPLAPGASETFFRTVSITETTTNTVFVDSESCAAPVTAQATVTVSEALPPLADSCLDGKPAQLVFEYTGRSCALSNNTQGDKFACSEQGSELSGETPVRIELALSGKDEGKTTVSPTTEVVTTSDVNNTNEVTFTATGSRLPAHTTFNIVQEQNGSDVILQSLDVHTSCSAPLAVGDEFGGVRLKKYIAEPL